MNKNYIIAAVVIIAIALAAFYLMAGSDDITAPDEGPEISKETDWIDYLGERGVLMENSLNASVSTPREVEPGVYFMLLKESFEGPAEGEAPVILVKTSDVYVDIESGETIVAAYYVTTKDAEKEKKEIFIEQLDPSSIDYSVDEE